MQGGLHSLPKALKILLPWLFITLLTLAFTFSDLNINNLLGSFGMFQSQPAHLSLLQDLQEIEDDTDVEDEGHDEL